LVSWHFYFIPIGNQCHTFDNKCIQWERRRGLQCKRIQPATLHWLRSGRYSRRILSIPCRRGHAGVTRMISGLIGLLSVLIIAPLIILVTMTMIFRSVAKIEKKCKSMERYSKQDLTNRNKPLRFKLLKTCQTMETGRFFY